MIIDRIERFGQYSRNIPEIFDVIKFVKKAKNENVAVGKYPIQNGFILVQEGTTRPFCDADFEVHKNYIDIQILISGSEYLEYADIDDLKTKTPYDAQKDLEMLCGEGNKIKIKPDTFYVMYPNDAHKPCCHENTPTNYKKLVAKIKIDKLIHKVGFN